MRCHHLKTSQTKLLARHKATAENIAEYRNKIDEHLSAAFSEELRNETDISVYIDNLTKILHKCAHDCIPSSSFNPFTRPGWTFSVREGRPRGMEFTSYLEYKKAKRNFRRALEEAHERYMCDVYKEIDEAAEVDIRLLWRLTKRRKPRTSRIYPEIQDEGGTTYTDLKGVAETFANYYQNIYTPLEDVQFDPGFKSNIDLELKHIIATCESDIHDLPGGCITTKELNAIISCLKLRKAPGYDSITNEHIVHGGKSLVRCLVNLYNAIVSWGKIPLQWKQGLIVPLYKGGSKPKNVCDSYRPVALLPCLFKIFEKIILSRISEFLTLSPHFPNAQQQGFQKSLSCLTAAFTLQETILHNIEQGNNVYVSFLDSSKAFDTVWREGLMFKLYNIGVTGKIWTLINNCHQHTTSSVIVNQMQSKWFSVNQGVRQGGVLSTFLYLVFINDLLTELEDSSKNIGVLNVPSSCPSLADDISCINLFPIGLQLLLNTAFMYSNKWRFRFNATKSCVLVFCPKYCTFNETFQWFLGQCSIPTADKYNH